MNNKKMIRGMSMMMVLLAIVLVASGVQAQDADNAETVNAYAKLGAGYCSGACRGRNRTEPGTNRGCCGRNDRRGL